MLRGLTVLHHRHRTGASGGIPVEMTRVPRSLHLITCQRWIWVTDQDLPPICQDPAPGSVRSRPELERFTGEEAYYFLLRVTTGLASELQGETNILGQVKQAWASRCSSFPWLQKLFEDTREIRARHLGDVGGPSYGRLLRRLLHPFGLSPSACLLLVGAGELARSVAPWLLGTQLLLLNRDSNRAQNLAETLRRQARNRSPIEVVPADDSESAWARADAAVLCVPYSPDQDSHRVGLLARRAPARKACPVIHLGGRRSESGAWSEWSPFFALDDLFLLHQSDDHTRQRQLERADRACRERAHLRSLGASLSIPHGWEDLVHSDDGETLNSEWTDSGKQAQYSQPVADILHA